MPELSPKPPEARKGHAITADWLNQVRDAVPRTISGDGVEVKRFGDRFILENNPEKIPRPEPAIQMMAVLQELDDVLVCVCAEQVSPPVSYDSTFADTLLNSQLYGGIFYVAKPRWLQRSFYESGSPVMLDGVPTTFQHQGTGQRISVPDLDSLPSNIGVTRYLTSSQFQTISPSYFAGDIIRVARADTGLYYTDPAIGDIPIVWMDINDNGRCWKSGDYSQRVKVKAYEGNGFWSANLMIRDNRNRTFVEQAGSAIRVLGTTVLDESSFDADDELIGSYIGYEPGGIYYITISTDVTGIELDSDITKYLPLDSSFDPDLIPAWLAGTYALGIVVVHLGFTWVSLVSTSGVPGSSADWLYIPVFTNRDGEFTTAGLFQLGEFTRKSSHLYQVTKPVAGTGTIIGLGMSGTDINISDVADAYDSGVVYSKGMISQHVGITYKYIFATPASNKTPATNPTYWEVISDADLTIINVPDASTTADGLVTRGNQSWTGNKTLESSNNKWLSKGAWSAYPYDYSLLDGTGYGCSISGPSVQFWRDAAGYPNPRTYFISGSVEVSDQEESSGTSRSFFTLFNLARPLGYAIRTNKYGTSSTVQANFTIPSVGGTVTITCSNTTSFAANDTLDMSDGTRYLYGHIVSVIDATHFSFYLERLHTGTVGATFNGIGSPITLYSLYRGITGTALYGATVEGGIVISLGSAITPGDVGLGSVENTALSTWTGSANIVTVGTIATGNWQGTAIADAHIASSATWNSALQPADIGSTVQAYSSTLGDIAANTWAGNSSIVTIGTITTGTWNAAIIDLAYGGTQSDLSATGPGILVQATTGAAIVAQQETDTAALTDSTGGTASGTIPAISGTGDDTNINNALASLITKYNALRDVLRNMYIMD